MPWNLSTGLRKAILGSETTGQDGLIANTITFTTNKIQDSGNGLGNFHVGDFIRVRMGANDNVIAKVLVASAAELEFASSTFTTAAAGTYVFIEALRGGSGSIADIFRGGILDLYDGAIPTDADAAESGNHLARLTLNGDSFSPGAMANGMNLALYGDLLKRAIDPNTGAAEKIQGDGIADGTASWGRYYANDVTTGASITAVRMDGIVSTTNGNPIVMAGGRTIVTGGPVAVTDIEFSITAI